MRRVVLPVLALLLPALVAAPAAADHVQPGFNLATWCSYASPQERGCSHSETFANRHIHWFGVTPTLGASLPAGSTITVTLTGTNAFTKAPFAASRTCDLGLMVFTPQPSTPVYGVNNLINNRVGDVSVHESCRVDIHTNFAGEVRLTVASGDGFVALIDAWVALL